MSEHTAFAITRTPELSVVVCTLNEHEAITGVLAGIDRALAGREHEIIVVDDSSDTRTAEAVLAYGHDRPWVRLIHRKGGRGLGSAAVLGWDAARGRNLALMDGDGQHDPQLLAGMLDARQADGCDVVIASRYLESSASGLGVVRHAMSRCGVLAARALLGLRIADPMSGCFLMSREWFTRVRPGLHTLGFKILIDVLAAGGTRPRVAQIPTRLRERTGGSSKLDLKVMLELAAQLVEKATRGLLPARMAMFFAVGISGLAVHLGVLGVATKALGLPLWAGQLFAIWLAMSWNFVLNNQLTFRDRRLHGLAALRGMLVFYAACLSGAILSEALAVALQRLDAGWLIAGGGGALIAGVWNYHLARRAAWNIEADAAIATEHGHAAAPVRSSNDH